MVFGTSSDAGGGSSRTLRSRRSLLRAASGLGVAALAGGTLTGCSQSSSGATRVRLWSWLTGMDQYVAAFNASQRDVHVELSVIAAGTSGGYAQQTNAIRAHNAPDILHTEYQALPQIVTTGGLRDLTDDVADLADGFLPAAWRSVRPDGRTWAVPMDFCPMAFFHRKDLFDKAGVQVPRTWEEFAEAAAAVRRTDPRARITTFPLNDGAFFAGMAWQAGDPWWRVAGDSWQVGIDTKGTMGMAGYWQDLVSSGKVAHTPTADQSWISSLHQGRLWGMLGATWGVGVMKRSLPTAKGKWAVTTLPTWGDKAVNGAFGGSAFAVAAQSEVPEAALTFLRWLSTDPAVPRIGAKVTFPSPAYLPSRKVAREAYKNEFFAGEPLFDVFDRAATRVPDWTWGPTSLSVFSSIADVLAPVPTGGTTIPRALHTLQSSTVATMRERGLAVRNGGRA
ncbi:ABC transporter substrate-binding protein [Streptomyces spiroverticillatus]|uniref:ABC transporter substrate-binding protein n=1 Tax=Streptomyces finlayi TaxID=67296 RepID=A0A919C9A0_9ACTN|nr:extracellular solute-binding protein [Streptomyces finlayi]GHA03595.1 ABC transporter substrate-binding protein [Streptomyces spiroverticillatus]GHC87745.1 ABC transporter substrate-binding protein [Streptomyces finlayi]